MGRYHTFRELQGYVLVTAEELRGECKIFAQETGGENTTVEKDFTDSRETGVWGFVKRGEPCRRALRDVLSQCWYRRRQRCLR